MQNSSQSASLSSRTWSVATVASAVLCSLLAVGCGKSATPAQRPTPSATKATARPPAEATAAATAETNAAPESAASKLAAPATVSDANADSMAPPPIKKIDPRKNGWALKSRNAGVKAGDRVFVLTRGRDRSHTDRRAVYHLYAHDVLKVKKDIVTLKELGGGDFQVSGSFVIPAGVASAKDLKKGDMVLAEWASSLKHATVIGFQGARVKIRYTDLPDSWAQNKITAMKSPRELTLQKEGMSPGNFAVAQLDGQRYLVLLVAPAIELSAVRKGGHKQVGDKLKNQDADKWVVRRFAGRVDTLPTSALTPIPLRPKLRRRQQVWVPWVGMMYAGKVRKTKGVHVYVSVDDIGQKKPILTPLGQVLPQ